MKLVTVEAFFASDQTSVAHETVSEQASDVRAMAGCAGYDIYRADGALAIVQKWQSMDSFDAYRGSPAFAGLIAALKPLMTAPPVTTIANVDT